MKLTLATCQFHTGADIKKNLDAVLRQLRLAKERGAHLVHFGEVALSGYAGIDYPSFAGFDWDALRKATERVLDEARKLRLWVVLGSTHQLTGKHKPHNCLYIIDPRGRIVDRYDKMFCTGPRNCSFGDLKHYSPGNHFVTFEVRGVRVGTLICHDFRYQELYREYRKRGVQLMLHSYHNAHAKAARLRKYNIWGEIVPPTTQAYAANNYMWVSANNASTPASCWPSFVVRPDGMITGRLRNNVPGVLITTIDTKAKLYDASSVWRDRAMAGVYHSGTLVRDPRSDDRTSL